MKSKLHLSVSTLMNVQRMPVDPMLTVSTKKVAIPVNVKVDILEMDSSVRKQMVSIIRIKYSHSNVPLPESNQ